MKAFWRTLAVLGFFAGLVSLLPANIALADNAVVGSGSAGSCTEAAFNTALATAHLNAGGTITFNCGGPATIGFTSQKTISSPKIITIIGGNEITLDGTSSTTGMFLVNSGATLNLIGLTVQNSTKSSGGGGAIRTSGTLTIVESTIRGNGAPGSGAVGGAMFITGGTVGIGSSTFSGNTSKESGGAIFNSSGNLTVTQSTFYNNKSTSAAGGAISQNGGTASIAGSTLSGNTAGGSGGAIGILGGSATVARSIVAGNSAGGAGKNCQYGTLTSLDYNLSNDATCPFNQTNDIQNSANIDLGSLADNGGSTLTMLPGDGSDAIDAAGACADPVDQRGQSRPSGIACDIGSVEVHVIPSSTYTLCVSRYTGRLYSPLSGVCNPYSPFELVTPDDYPLTFCLSLYTGAVSYSFGPPCPVGSLTHVVPDDEDLLTCVSMYTGANRFVSSHDQCTLVELQNTIYGN